MLTAASIGQKLIAFLYFALIARTIGDEATGAYFIALALTTSIGVLDDVGLTAVVIREVAKTPERTKELLRNVIGIKLITMPLTIVLAFVLPAWRGFDTQTTMLVDLAIIVMLLDTISVTMYGVLRGMHQLKYESVGIFIGQTLTTIVGVVALLSGARDLRLLVVALIVGSGWNAVFALYQVVKRAGWGAFVPSYSQALPILKVSFVFFLAGLFVKVYSYIDSFTIQEFLGNDAVGVYAVAYKFTYAFQFLPLAFVGALYPTMSALADMPAELNRTLMKAEWYLSMLAAPIVFGIFALAPEIVDFFYSNEFAGAGPVLGVLIFVLLFIFLDFPIGSLLNATGRQTVKTGLMGGAMVVNIIGNALLVPKLGIMGAAVAALVTFVFLFGGGWIAAMRLTKVSFIELMKVTGGFFAAGAIMAVVVILLKSHIYWMFTIPVGALVFVGASFATRALTVEHIRQIKTLMKPNYVANSPSDN